MYSGCSQKLHSCLQMPKLPFIPRGPNSCEVGGKQKGKTFPFAGVSPLLNPGQKGGILEDLGKAPRRKVILIFIERTHLPVTFRKAARWYFCITETWTLPRRDLGAVHVTPHIRVFSYQGTIQDASRPFGPCFLWGSVFSFFSTVNVYRKRPPHP